MITNALVGVIVVYLLYLLRLFALPVAIGLCLAFVITTILDIYLNRK